MKSSSASQNQTNLRNSSRQKNPEGISRQEQPRKRHPGFSKQSLQNDLNDINKQTEEFKQELPKDPNQPDDITIQREIELLDQKQRVWVFLYKGFLMYYIYKNVPLGRAIISSEFFETMSNIQITQVLSSILVMLALISPYLVQLLAIFKKSLKLNNIALKIIGFISWLGFLQLAFMVLTVYDYGLYKKTLEFIYEKFELVESGGEKIQYLSREVYNWMVYETIAECLIHFALTYGGARLYKRYLLKREALLRQKTE